MKIIKSLKDFDKIDEAITPEKAKFSFEISSNTKKVAKIRKTLIDIQQLLSEMGDEIVALKLSYDNLDSQSAKTINNMQANINKTLVALGRQDPDETTGIISNMLKLERNLGRLKSGVLKNKGA